jgi:hypothetical protein
MQPKEQILIPKGATEEEEKAILAAQTSLEQSNEALTQKLDLQKTAQTALNDSNNLLTAARTNLQETSRKLEITKTNLAAEEDIIAVYKIDKTYYDLAVKSVAKENPLLTKRISEKKTSLESENNQTKKNTRKIEKLTGELRKSEAELKTKEVEKINTELNKRLKNTKVNLTDEKEYMRFSDKKKSDEHQKKLESDCLKTKAKKIELEKTENELNEKIKEYENPGKLKTNAAEAESGVVLAKANVARATLELERIINETKERIAVQQEEEAREKQKQEQEKQRQATLQAAEKNREEQRTEKLKQKTADQLTTKDGKKEFLKDQYKAKINIERHKKNIEEDGNLTGLLKPELARLEKFVEENEANLIGVQNELGSEKTEIIKKAALNELTAAAPSKKENIMDAYKATVFPVVQVVQQNQNPTPKKSSAASQSSKQNPAKQESLQPLIDAADQIISALDAQIAIYDKRNNIERSEPLKNSKKKFENFKKVHTNSPGKDTQYSVALGTLETEIKGLELKTKLLEPSNPLKQLLNLLGAKFKSGAQQVAEKSKAILSQFEKTKQNLVSERSPQDRSPAPVKRKKL